MKYWSASNALLLIQVSTVKITDFQYSAHIIIYDDAILERTTWLHCIMQEHNKWIKYESVLFYLIVNDIEN